MSLDKLVDSSQLDTDLTSVANAIRTKGGTSAQLAFPAGFVSAVQAIPTGTTPTGTKQISITANGTTTEDVTNYASAEITVNVPVGWTSENVAKNLAPSGRVELTYHGNIEVYALSGKPITELFAPNTRLQTSALAYCPQLQTAVIGGIGAAGQFNECSNLRAADFTGKYGGGINGTFNKCTNLTVLVLRRTTVNNLSNVIAFSNSPFASGKAGGTLYVPQALIASYQAATNWSTILSYGSGAQNSILPIEGSIYETQYVDGTPIT